MRRGDRQDRTIKDRTIKEAPGNRYDPNAVGVGFARLVRPTVAFAGPIASLAGSSKAVGDQPLLAI
jgi:hypothetical protein